jgi:hypothetical protein
VQATHFVLGDLWTRDFPVGGDAANIVEAGADDLLRMGPHHSTDVAR